MKFTDETIHLLSNLIALPSVNPCADADCTVVPYGEARMADFVEAYFRPLNLPVTRQETRPGRCNVLVQVPGDDPSAAPILLEAHMDTVDVEGMQDPFNPRVEGGQLFGRGACDTKGSLTAMMVAVRELVEAGARFPQTVHLVAAVDEEWGMSGVRRLIASGTRYAGAVVGEPTSLRVVPATLGQVYFRIIVQGKAAHTSTPDRGVNAIYLMTEVIRVLRVRSKAEYAQNAHALCGPSLLTVSMIGGGNSEHVVPSECRIAIDLRLRPGSSWEQMLPRIQQWLDSDLDSGTAERVAIIEPHHDVPPLETQTSHPLVQAMAAACEEELGEAQVVGVPYNTDGSWLSQAGVPVVVFGPGSIAQAHSANEYVPLNEVRQAANVLKTLLTTPLP